MGTKFQVFRNETGVVFDIEEERRRVDDRDFDEPETFPSPYSDLNLERELNFLLSVSPHQLFNFRWCQWSFRD